MRKIGASILIGLSIVFCITATIWGLLHTQFEGKFWSHLLLVLLITIVITLVSQWTRKSALSIGLAAIAAISLATGVLWPLLVALWFFLASTLLGHWLLRKLGAADSHWTCELLTGAGLLGTAVGLLAHIPANYPVSYGVALTAPIILLRRDVQLWFQDVKQWFTKAIPPDDLTSRCLEIFIVASALVHFVTALMPEVGHDALVTHLFVPAHLALRHKWGFDVTTYVWAVMPMLGDWIFATGYMLAGETAARIINVGFTFVLCFLLRDLVLWAGGTAIGVRWAILLFLTTPLTFTETSSLYIDSVWTAFIIAGSLSVFKLLQSDASPEKHLPAAGMLLGSALAAKAVTFTVLPALLFFPALRYRIWTRWVILRWLSLSLILFIAMGAIPYLTALIITGNPVFPFFNQIFQSPFYPSVNFEAGHFGKGLTWDFLYQATFHTGKYLASGPGGAGFQWLLLFIPVFLALLIFRKYRGVLLFIVAVFSVFLTFESTAYLRYILPAYVWIIGAIGVSLSAGGQQFIRFITPALSVLAWTVICLNLLFFKNATPYSHLSPKPLMSIPGREAYLNVVLPIRNAIEIVNRINVRNTPVAVFSLPLAAGLKSDALYPSWYNAAFQEDVMSVKTENDVADILLRRSADIVILDSNWNGIGNKKGPETLKLIKDATDSIAELGTISVRKVKSCYRFQKELLSEPAFSARGNWAFPPQAWDQHSREITVTVSSPATQAVAIEAGRQYRNSVTAICTDRPGFGRVQINWMDAGGKFISTDISVFRCSNIEETHTLEVAAPRNASTAIVYASSHTEIPITFRKVSFQQ